MMFHNCIKQPLMVRSWWWSVA